MLSPLPFVLLVLLLTPLSGTLVFLFALPLVSLAFVLTLAVVSFALFFALSFMTLCPFSISFHATLPVLE